MPRRTLAFVIFAIAVAAVCIRLGIWQLDRGAERRERNARIGAQLRATPVPFDRIAAEGDSARYRRVTVTGVADYAQERVHASRTHGGSPGVNILTPVRVVGRDTAVLVNRGWVYAPDGVSANLDRWREGDTLVVTGYVERFVDASEGSGPATVRDPRGGRPVLRRLEHAALAASLPYPLARVHVVATEARSIPASAKEHPVRLAAPELGNGPHLGYAIQWFAFALIALIGAGAVAVKSRSSARG